MFTVHTSRWRPARVGLVLAATALLVAACGSATSSATSGGSGHAVASSTKSVTVSTRSGSLGTYLTDASGRTLYMFQADHGGTSSCSGACAATWPPLVARGHVHAAGQAKASQLGTSSRGAGVRQVTYHGRPLYYFANDSAPGQTSGQGLSSFGAPWWVVAPGGRPITHAMSGSGGSGSSTGSGGGGWG